MEKKMKYILDYLGFRMELLMLDNWVKQIERQMGSGNHHCFIKVVAKQCLQFRFFENASCR